METQKYQPKTSLRDYLRALSKNSARYEFAAKCGTSLGQLRNIAFGTRPCNVAVALNADKHSNGAVPMQELIPDLDYQYLGKICRRHYTPKINEGDKADGSHPV